ncbi:hypothetical protein LPJ53_006496, partial [Coemansia erecta]
MVCGMVLAQAQARRSQLPVVRQQHRDCRVVAQTAATILLSAAAKGTTINQVSQSVIDGFAYGVPYLHLNTLIIVMCHSEASLSSGLFSEEASMVYGMAGYHRMHDIAARDSLDPHVFELVAVAYAHMRRLHQDQAI